ncbi:MAG: peptide ABC transporter substrate-binding protein [Pyrinomonadaceae bacterium]|nr:peptide ABC transporter substrate-binding protein [Pyrinomonadaceae bacterium]
MERWRGRAAACLILVISLTGGCFLDHEVEPFYGRVSVPRTQEFRWSNGGLPQTFDPALAAAPPETDVIRAMFEGLTDYDPKTLAPVPAVAERWESTPDNLEWTFHLRRDARWSNNDPVTAQDFVNSWKRTLKMGDSAPHARLLANIRGVAPPPTTSATTDTLETQPQSVARVGEKKETKAESKKEKAQEPQAPPPFGAEALDDHTLRVRLVRADANFPSLVAHPVFRPVHDIDAQLPSPMQAQRVVSNGAFQFTRATREGVTLERAGNYWDARSVSLQRVQFVAAQNTEAALSAYRAGEVDAVTNAGFEPLAIKLLAPYKDFRRSTYGAITFYSFNTAKAPFDDVRVREALAIVIDRDRICEDEMGGATEPARRFLPETEELAHTENKLPTLEKNVTRAQTLLAAAGFPKGAGFPVLRLLINRNEQQRQVAESVAEMWRTSLGIKVEVISKPWDEYEQAVKAGDYDVVRRGFVMQTMDEETNMRLMFDTTSVEAAAGDAASPSPEKTETPALGANANQNGKKVDEKRLPERSAPLVPPVLSEEQALRELPAIPIYFASSYQLIKPYVVGFDTNLLDAPSLKSVRIETGWQQPQKASATWYK